MFQLDVLLNASDEGAEYTLLYVPALDENKVYFGFLEPQKEYMTWEFSLDNNNLRVSDTDLIGLMISKSLGS